jgi:hypothetical protein
MMHFLVHGHKYKQIQVWVSCHGGHHWYVCMKCYDKGKALL